MPIRPAGEETRPRGVLSARRCDRPPPTARRRRRQQLLRYPSGAEEMRPPERGRSLGGSMSRSDRARARPTCRSLAHALLLGSAAVSIVGKCLRGCHAASRPGRPKKPELKTIKLGRSRPVRALIYVYDDPALDSTDLIQCYRDRHDGVAPWQDERADMAQDMGEIWLHRALLGHPWRVLDPEDADLFFVPLYPVLGYKLLGMDKTECKGRTHRQRVDGALNFLERESTYFRRFGGADHVLVCAWWNCRMALTPWHRMLLRRAVVSVNERLPAWGRWGCADRMVTVPYTASSVITTSEVLGGLEVEKRDIPFFFVGTGRDRPERQNLEVVRTMFPESVIELGDDEREWGMNATVYADHMFRSRFCFCPRGDSMTSRRIYDAVSAGCVPVLSVDEARALPFLETGLDYSEFAVMAPLHGFGSHENVTAIVNEISSSTEDELESLQQGLKKGRNAIVYGKTTGPDFNDMHPFRNVASRFLQASRSIGSGENLWSCPPTEWTDQALSPRTREQFPLSENSRKQWLFESETIVNAEHSLLFCAPPNTGSLQFRMLAKRMKGVDHWAVSNNRSLLFDPVASELTLLDVQDVKLMSAIYKENGSGWIKIGVVRDPVTRLVSAYLDLVRAVRSSSSLHSDSSGHNRRGLGLLDGERDWLNAITRGRRGGFSVESGGREEVDKEEGHGRGLLDEKEPKVKGPHFVEDGGAATAPIVPTFTEMLEALTSSIRSAPPGLRPMVNMCGMRHSSFDSVIPFETLQKTSTEVLKSLPNGIWEAYGASGWGPRGEHAFMAFDYGGVPWPSDHQSLGAVINGMGEGGSARAAAAAAADRQTDPRRALDLFGEGSCAWTEYYPDEKTLETVASLYEADYDHFRWYDVDHWKEKLRLCSKKQP